MIPPNAFKCNGSDFTKPRVLLPLTLIFSSMLMSGSFENKDAFKSIIHFLVFIIIAVVSVFGASSLYKTLIIDMINTTVTDDKNNNKLFKNLLNSYRVISSES